VGTKSCEGRKRAKKKEINWYCQVGVLFILAGSLFKESKKTILILSKEGGLAKA